MACWRMRRGLNRGRRRNRATGVAKSNAECQIRTMGDDNGSQAHTSIRCMPLSTSRTAVIVLYVDERVKERVPRAMQSAKALRGAEAICWAGRLVSISKLASTRIELGGCQRDEPQQ